MRQIYGAIAYYLEHEAEAEAYLEWRKEEGDAIRREFESDQVSSLSRKIWPSALLSKNSRH